MKLTKIVLYLIILTIIVAGMLFYSWIIKYLIGAVIFAYIINPWINWLEKYYVPRFLGIIMVYVVMGLLVAWGVIKILPTVIDQAQNLLEFIRSSSRQGEISLLKIPFIQNLQQKVIKIDTQVPILKLNDNFINIIKSMNYALMNVPNFLVDNYQKILEAVTLIATIPLIGFFLLKDNHKFRKDFLKLIPNRYFEIVIILLHKIDEIVGRYLRAMFFEIIIVGSLAAIVLRFLGVSYAFLIGFMAGIANVIPYFGPIMGVLFAIVSILITGNPPILIFYSIIAMYLIQVFDNNIIYPVVIGKSIEMHPLIVLLTVLAGGWAWGLIGMLVSVPIVYLIYGVIKVLYINLREFNLI